MVQVRLDECLHGDGGDVAGVDPGNRRTTRGEADHPFLSDGGQEVAGIYQHLLKPGRSQNRPAARAAGDREFHLSNPLVVGEGVCALLRQQDDV